jgi:TolB-like protein/DNA-binding winged helix-turn-helix (wHTH) protein/Flp pilus assembly protein TadD
MVRSGSAQERLKVGAVTRAPAYEFAPFRLDTACRQLIREGQPIAVPPKAYDILVALVENRERLVERDELMQLVWPDVAVEEANLTQNVFTLRKILGDDQTSPRFIETLPRRGYRFIAPVAVIHDSAHIEDAAVMGAARSPLFETARKPHRLRPVLYVVGILMAAAAIGVLLLFFRGWGDSVPASTGERIRLAVLPFVNLSADPEQEYFSDGLTEELIAHLGSLRPQRLAVIARTSAMRYKGTRQGVDDIGRELGVQYVVEGSIRRSSGQVRITARLVNVIDQADLWTETYERSLADIFAIHRDIAARVSRSLAVELLPNEQPAGPRLWTTNPAAYESYLLGIFHSVPTEASAKKSIAFFEQAIRLDPGYAPAHARLAFSYHFLASSNLAPDREMYPRARDAALQALALDDTHAGAHAALAFVKWRFDWDWSGAKREFIRTLELDENHSGHGFGLFLYSTGSFDEAIAQMERAQSLDPLDFLVKWNLGRVFLTVHRFDAATAQFRRALQIRPDHPWPYSGIGLALLEQGRTHEAITELERARQLGERDPNVTSRLAYAFARIGNTTAAERLLRELENAGNGDPPGYHIALVYHALGRQKAALAWLEKAYAARDDTLVYLKVDPLLQTFRSDPGVQDLIRRIGIP